jgi:hypothetical protein
VAVEPCYPAGLWCQCGYGYGPGYASHIHQPFDAKIYSLAPRLLPALHEQREYQGELRKLGSCKQGYLGDEDAHLSVIVAGANMGPGSNLRADIVMSKQVIAKIGKMRSRTVELQSRVQLPIHAILLD